MLECANSSFKTIERKAICILASFISNPEIPFARLSLFILGVKPVHLIARAIMSAPAALAMSKLLYPETHNSSLNQLNKVKFEPA